MAPIKITRVVSCSSEDNLARSKNLLLSDSFKKWSTNKPGVLKASVILQLESQQQITGLDIGNNGSAFVEVLVANSANAGEPSDYENLIITSAFMTPSESRSQTNRFKIRMFAKDELCKQTLDKKWDRIKIVCTQPYNKSVPFGLSVVAVQGVHKPLPKLDTPRKIVDDVKPKVAAAAVPSKAPEVEKKVADSENKEGKAASELLSKLQQSKVSTSNEALQRLKESGDKGFKTLPISLTSTSRSVVDITDPDDDKPSKVEKSETPRIKNKPGSSSAATSTGDFSTLLSDVVFVLSGFQNPLRSDIREIGLSMGGQYRPDWCSEATHLVCAIPNTPKYNQVKGKGIIISKEWLFDCKRERRRIPERKYRLDQGTNSSSDENEDEEKEDEPARNYTKRKHSNKINYVEDDSTDADEESTKTSNKKRKTESKDKDEEFVPTQIISSDDGEDEEEEHWSEEEEKEEAEEVEDESYNGLMKSEKVNTKPLLDISDDDDDEIPNPARPALPDISDSESETDITPVHDAETDDETESDVIKRLGLPPLPDIFTGHKFFVHSDSFDDREEMRQMNRYLVAYGGKVYEHMSTDVKFIVTKSDSWLPDFCQALQVNPNVRFLKSSWVEISSDQMKAVAKTSYYVNQ